MALTKFEKIIALWLAGLTTATSIISIYTFVLETHPHLVGYEAVQRITNTSEEVYRLEVVNTGKGYASNVKISIIFPFQNTTIYNIDKSKDETILNETGGIGNYFYTVEFEKCRENQLLVVFVYVKNSEFNSNNSQIILPDSKVWSDEEGEISIQYLEGIKFIH